MSLPVRGLGTTGVVTRGLGEGQDPVEPEGSCQVRFDRSRDEKVEIETARDIEVAVRSTAICEE